MDVFFELFILLLLVILNGVFSMSEIAVLSSRAPRLQDRANRGDKGARTALELKESPNNFLSTVQCGITLIGILAGAFGGVTFRGKIAAWLEQIPGIGLYSQGLSFWIVVLVTSYLSLVIGELVPKHLALARTETLASWIARPMKWLSLLMSPVVWVLSRSTDLMIALFRLQPNEEPPVTEEEVKIMIRQGAQAGVFEPEEHELVRSVFRFADKRVTSLMTPRSEIVWLNVGESSDSILDKISLTGYSRFPVCEGDLDKVIGIVSVRDLWQTQVKGEPTDLAAIARKPLFVMESISGFQLHKLFRQAGIHTALVIDEYGVIKGLVSLVDLMTAIMGELPEEERPSESMTARQEDGSWLFDAMISFHDFREIMNLGPLTEEEESEDYQILAGFVLAKLDEFPKEGSEFEFEGLRFKVLHMDHNRIDQVQVSPIAPPEIEPGVEETTEAKNEET